MEDAGIKQTTAYRVIRQVIDHTWGSDEELDDSDIVTVCKNFRDQKGSWKNLLDGEVESFNKLEKALTVFFHNREIYKIAYKIAFDLTESN